MNCPSSCGRGGVVVRSEGPWPAVSWGMQVVTGVLRGMGRGSGESVWTRAGVQSGRIKENRVVPTCEGPWA